MIDEKKLIEELEMHCNNINPNSLLYLVKGAWDDCIKIINRQPKVGEWIPCSERLPKDENREYIICKKRLFCMLVTWSKAGWNTTKQKDGTYNDEYRMNDVVAWMEKPEVYKGEK